ncbi:oxidoreductase [Rugamonas sp.]|uniref:oxidoreductase n=1 Tax=Rugamonas sp. TaxID=1926287 RepID=UPI0025E8D50B|nr:oxidoreductase [Rugamonas sp.]
MTTTHAPQVWFITGCSTGLGLELARQVLAAGHHAVVSARDKGRLDELVALAPERALAVDLDVNDSAQIAAGVAAAQARFGRIDVLVNNAGYGYMSSIEEGEEEQIRAQFDANVFGLFAMTRAVLPVMRAQRSGYVISLTSVAGYIGFPGSGYYAASKHAVEGWSDALAAETASLGIRVSCVAPGPARTDWAGRSMTQTPNLIADYADTVGARMRATSAISGQQPGDPVRIAQMIVGLADLPRPPRHLVLGQFGINAVSAKLQGSRDEIEAWRERGAATDFPAA